MAVKKKPLPKRHLHSEKAIFDLVSTRGVSKTICIAKLGLPANYFNAYSGTNDNFNSAMAHFTSEILMKNVTANLEYDGASRKFLMQKLRVFDQEVKLPIKHMKTAKHASTNLSFALHAYSMKLISDETLQAVRQSCEVFSKLMTSTILEEKITNLEQLFKEKFDEKR